MQGLRYFVKNASQDMKRRNCPPALKANRIIRFFASTLRIEVYEANNFVHSPKLAFDDFSLDF